MSSIGLRQVARGRCGGVFGILLVFAAALTVFRIGWLPYAASSFVELVPTYVVVSVVIFFSAVISSTVGFAFSAIAAAMIFHLVPDNVQAVQIMMLASIGIQAYSVVGIYHTISWRACSPFLIGAAVTIPAGIYLLLNVRPQTYIFAMGIALTVYGSYMLMRRPLRIEKSSDMLNAAIGSLGGLTGPLAAFPGAFVTIWCGMQGWDKVAQRSIYQPYILVVQMLTLVGLSAVSGRAMLDAELLTYTLPGIAGAYVGLRVFHQLSDAQFQRLVNLALIASGLALTLK